MSTAVANVLGVNAINVVLTFIPVTLDRRSGQPAGVLVNAGVTDVDLSAASYASKITQDKFDKEMTAMGLRYGQLISTGMKRIYIKHKFLFSMTQKCFFGIVGYDPHSYRCT